MYTPIKDMAKSMKAWIPDIPAAYSVKPEFWGIADEESIRNGVLAFRDFMLLLYDRLMTDGNLYDKPPKEEGHVSRAFEATYPFLNHLRSVLVNMVYQGSLSAQTLYVNWESLVHILGPRGEWMSKAKISGPKLIEVLRFLTRCGVHVSGIDLDAKKSNLSQAKTLVITVPDNPAVLTGMKVMATAHKRFDDKDYNDVLLRCDYRILKAEKTDVMEFLKEFANPLPEKARDFALSLHRRYIEQSLRYRAIIGLGHRFLYFHKNTELFSLESGRILIKAKKIQQDPDIIRSFALPLQEKINKGYGCEKKLYGLPCQHGCHGYSFPLDESILDLSKDIETWLDYEVSCLRK
ncbi:MAG: hypothetical protein LBI19_04430 [Oscillospiraceae bacterium]|jgi:hypothetical protein|nr:hypothetical protein [Oscillospiraceae bacterium]